MVIQIIALMLSVLANEALAAKVAPVNKQGSEENNPWVFDAKKAFSYIPVRSHNFFSIATNDAFMMPHYQTFESSRRRGYWSESNYFCGVKRLPMHLGLGRYLAVIGSNPHIPASQLCIVDMGSQENHHQWDSKLQKKDRVRDNDNKIMKTVTIDKDYWLAGGVDMAGKYLAIPITQGSSSKIVFYDLADPLKPKRIPGSVERLGEHSDAVGITRLSQGNYLLAVWKRGKNRTESGIDFYFSKNSSLAEGFQTDYMVTIPENRFSGTKERFAFRSLNFVHDYADKAYLIATENSTFKDPIPSGVDYICLFDVELYPVTDSIRSHARNLKPNDLVASLPLGSLMPTVNFIEEKHVYCKKGMCSFNAGSSIYIPDQQHIYVYSVPRWVDKTGKALACSQYATIQKTYPC